MPLICFFGMFLLTPAFAEDSWTTYTHANYINGIAVRGDSVWCATSGGVVCWNTADSTYTKYTIRDGLGENYVHCIDIDPKGDIWCGTNNGVSRFHDGMWQTHSFETAWWRPVSVQKVVAGPDGSVWCSAENVIYRFRDGAWESVYRAFENIYAMTMGRNGDIWAALESDYWPGVWRFRNDRPMEKSTLPVVRDFSTGPDGRAWCAVQDSLLLLEEDRWIKFAARDFTHLAVAPDSTIWARTVAGELMRYDGEDWTPCPVPVDLSSSDIFPLATGTDGVLWCGTARTYDRGMGLSRFDGNSWKTYTISDGPTSRMLTSLAAGADGSIWCGTRKSGVVRFDGNRWQSFTTADGLSDNSISSVAIAPDGGVWCGVYDVPGKGGAARFDGERWKMYTSEDGIIGSFIDMVFSGPGGDMICRSVDPSGGHAFSRFDGSTWKRYTLWDNPPGDQYALVAFGPGETCWNYFYKNELMHFDGRNWTAHAVPDSIGQIFCLAAAPDGSAWGGGYQGVWRFDGNSWKTWSTADGLAGNWVDQIVIGKDGEVWCTTEFNMVPDGLYGAGAARFDGKAWRQYTTAEGLASNWVESITIGPDGRVYFLTSGGISVLTSDTGVAVREDTRLPARFAILGNRPNPFNPSTTISFTLPAPGRATLTIYDITGRKVRTLVSGSMQTGVHSVVWDGKDERGAPVSSGVYIALLRAGKTSANLRMAVVK